MNANELAEWVDKQSSFGWSGDFGKFLIEIATMLRQQQAEIEALKKELETCKTIVALSNIAWERKHGKD